MTAEEIEPEKWALELWHAADDAAAECARDEAGYPNYAAALTIQRAFEERERKLREDAARYRWLRDVSCPPHNFYISVPDEFHGVKYGPDEVDAYIDAARAALGEKP